MVWNSNCDHFTYISFKKYLGSKDLKTSCILGHPRVLLLWSNNMKVLKQKTLLICHYFSFVSSPLDCLDILFTTSRYWRLIRTEKWKKFSEHSPWCYACYAKYGSDMIGWEFEAIITYNLWFKNTWETMETFWEFGGNLSFFSTHYME